MTFLGDKFDDLEELTKSAIQVKASFSFEGEHVDMKAKCWESGYFGRGLRYIHKERFGGLPEFPDTYEGLNHCDCFMTLALYKAWRKGNLAVPNPSLR